MESCAATDRSHSTDEAAAGMRLQDMVKIPEADFLFKVSGIEIEGFNDIGVDVQYPWEDSPRRFHEHPMHVKLFLHRQVSGHKCCNSKSSSTPPIITRKDDLNFLRDWKDGNYPNGLGEQAGDLGFPGRRASLRELGRKASAP